MKLINGHTITVRRAAIGEPGWLWEATNDRGTVAYWGWTIGQGPRAKSEAMRDAISAVNAGPVPVDPRITPQDLELAAAALAAPVSR